MRYLFVGHSAKGTGAPRSFLSIIESIRSIDKDFSCEIVLVRDGELKKDYMSYGNVSVLLRNGGWKYFNKVNYYLKRKWVERGCQKGHYDVLFVNSTLSWFFIRDINFGSLKKCVIRIPEGKDTLVKILGSSLNQFKIKISKHFQLIVPSIANQKNLSEIIPLADFRVIYGIQTRTIHKSLSLVDDLNVFTKNKFIIGGGGRFVWQKGIDLFFKVAEELSRVDEDIRFVWVGAKSGFVDDKGLSEFEKNLRSDLVSTGTIGNVKVIPFKEQPEECFQYFDIYFLSSRWDPFPLVVLENAELGVPTICYRDAGGAAEFVGETNGVIVPFASISDVVNQIIKLKNDKSKHCLLKKNCKESVRSFNDAYLMNELNVLLGL